MTAPISNGPTTHGYTTMRDATPDRRFLSRSLGDEARSLHIRARQLGSSGGFALLGALGARVIGVSEARVVQNPPLNDAVAAKVLVPLWCYTI